MKEFRDNYNGKGYEVVRIIDDDNVIIKQTAIQIARETAMTPLDRKQFYKSQAKKGDYQFLTKGALPDNWDQHKMEKQGLDPRRNESIGYAEQYDKTIFSKRAYDAAADK